jgi:four helix bundle protein
VSFGSSAHLYDVGRHEDLVAYQHAAALADDLRAAVRDWPSIDQWTVGVQLIRAADSVGANIAESVGRSTDRDEQRFLLYARGSVSELRHWIERAFARGLLSDESLRGRAARVGQLVNGLHRASRSK